MTKNTLHERALQRAVTAYYYIENGSPIGAAIIAYLDCIAQEEEVMRNISMQLAAIGYKKNSFLKDCYQDVGIYAAECWNLYREDAKSILQFLIKIARGEEA